MRVWYILPPLPFCALLGPILCFCCYQHPHMHVCAYVYVTLAHKHPCHMAFRCTLAYAPSKCALDLRISSTRSRAFRATVLVCIVAQVCKCCGFVGCLHTCASVQVFGLCGLGCFVWSVDVWSWCLWCVWCAVLGMFRVKRWLRCGVRLPLVGNVCQPAAHGKFPCLFGHEKGQALTDC